MDDVIQEKHCSQQGILKQQHSGVSEKQSHYTLNVAILTNPCNVWFYIQYCGLCLIYMVQYFSEI